MFSRRDALNRHKSIHSHEKMYSCDICKKTFNRKDTLKRHELFHLKEKTMHTCKTCEQQFSLKSELMKHIRTQHTSQKRKHEDFESSNKRKCKNDSALGVFISFDLFPDNEICRDLNTCLNNMRSMIMDKLMKEILDKTAIKWYVLAHVELSRTTMDGEEEIITAYFRCKCYTELNNENIDQHITEGYSKIYESFEEFIQRGSNWRFERIIKLELFSAQYHPLAASSYLPLPDEIAKKKAVLNIQNDDQKCFTWCILAHKMKLNYRQKPERVSHYLPYEKDILMGNVDYPVPLCKIPVLERLNNLRVNVFGLDNKEIIPLHISDKEDIDAINLLLINNEGRLHYCLIRNFSRLLSDLTKHDGKRFYCYRCLHRFSREDLLKEHVILCNQHKVQKIKMPSKDDCILSFTNRHYQHDLPYAIYADFESLIVPFSTVTQDSNKSYTMKKHYHVPCGYAFIIIGPDGKAVKPIQCYRGENAVQHFLQSILEEKEELAEKMYAIKPLEMTPEEEDAFQSATYCFLCEKELKNDRVRDHDHMSGQFRGALHKACNLKYRLTKIIPVIFHNLKNYDMHHIMQGIGQIKHHKYEVIATNMEKYLTFSLSSRKDKYTISLRFIDSYQFMPTSLEKLVENLSHDKFNILRESFSDNTQLLLRKGIYPYEYLSNFDKFEEVSLPCKEAFYSSLTEESITNEEYEYAQNIWNIFNMKTLGDYHDFYVKVDVLQLADVFQNFRNVCKNNYDLDCTHLFTSPGLAWEASLKMTDIKLELLTDINMHLFIESGIRGGVSMISQRYAKANNKYTDPFDSTEASRYIMYWDANNLYGLGMSQPLPYGGFEWAKADEFNTEKILTLKNDALEGYIFEVDLTYPYHLHDLHNDYPLAVERIEISKNMLSNYSSNMLQSKNYKSTKLVPNLKDKKKYVVHYRNLQLYLSLGMRLEKIHRVLKFKQYPWLKPYINFNTEQRKKSKIAFEKDFFKLMNNSVYGKTMENVRNRVDIQLINDENKAKKLVACPTFKAFKIFTEDLVGVERMKKTLTLNRPIYVGFTILELSKYHMYDFHYNFIKKQYGLNAQLLFTDTDSLTYEIRTEDIYQDMMKHLERFDTSDYPPYYSLYSEKNKKVIGKFKDELNGKIIYEFVGLRSKMYSFDSEEGEKKRAKGVARTIVKNKLKHENYKNCLLNSTITREQQTRIQSENHQLFTIATNKIALSPFDDKRYILEDGIHSLAYGHHKIDEN